MTKAIYLTFFLFLSLTNNAQQIVSSEFLESQTAGQLQAQFLQNFNNGVDMYRILYKTTDIHGVPDTASGLLIVPDEPNFNYPLLCYQHGTINSRWDVPSQLAGGYELAMAISGQGFAVLAPDFLGLGESRGLHPYVHAETEARAAIDMLFAVQEYADVSNDLTLNDQLFITGYSQGGHAALAAHKYIEENYSDYFTVTASSPMSGPYSISEKMKDFTLSDEQYNFVSYIAWVTLSYELAYGDLFTDLGDFFKAPYVPFIEQFANEEITLSELNTSLIQTLIAQNGAGQVKPKLMLQDDILYALLNDPTHPASMALADNDLVDWVPLAPTRLMGCTADDQVTFQNATFTSQIMNDNGATDVAAVDVNPTADHGACVIPATLATILFFQGYQQIGIIESAQEPLSANALINIQPNPATDYVNVQLTEFANSNNSYDLSLYNVNGKLLHQTQLSGRGMLKVSTRDIAPGIYLLQVRGEEGVYTRKVVVE
ncbi:MAG: hypothetical protein ACI9VN_002566 [Patescibacteria group bacterium]|jgi:hypothetical protein